MSWTMRHLWLSCVDGCKWDIVSGRGGSREGLGVCAGSECLVWLVANACVDTLASFSPICEAYDIAVEPFALPCLLMMVKCVEAMAVVVSCRGLPLWDACSEMDRVVCFFRWWSADNSCALLPPSLLQRHHETRLFGARCSFCGIIASWVLLQ